MIIISKKNEDKYYLFSEILSNWRLTDVFKCVPSKSTHWAFNQLMEVGWQPDLSGEPLDQF